MENLNQIGLDNEQAKYISDRLNQLLANYSVFYMNVRGLHWNIKGHNFFSLHQKFEDLYNKLELRIDEIAERILSLGYTPQNAFSEYLNISVVREIQNVSQPEEAVSELLDGLKILIQQQKEVAGIADKANDISTCDMMTEYVRDEEKLVWMFSAYMQESAWA